MISEYLDNPIVYYYDYNMVLTSYSMLVDSIMDYDKDNKTEIDTSYMHEFTSIKSCFDIYYYHFDDDMGRKINSYRFNFMSVNKYNGNYDDIKKDLTNYISGGNTVILCIDNKDTAKRVVKYLDIDDIILTSEDNIVNGKINLINKNISKRPIQDEDLHQRIDLFLQEEQSLVTIEDMQNCYCEVDKNNMSGLYSRLYSLTRANKQNSVTQEVDIDDNTPR